MDCNIEQAINYKGRLIKKEKNFVYGTHRTCSPEETYGKIERHFKQVGLTRLANITGLDKLGLPVVLSVRPNSGYLAVDAGKGFTLIAAKVSAAMECIERYHAENVFPERLKMSYNELLETHTTISMDKLPLMKNSLFSPEQQEEWSFAWDFVAKEEVAIPTMLLTLQRHLSKPSNLLNFQLGSNGLASGNHVLEAFCSGLYEVIERDAVTSNLVANETASYKIPKVKLETIEFPLVLKLLNMLNEAKIETILYDCTIDTDVPTYMAVVYDLESREIGMYRGYGSHLDPEIAMIRAITEAAQARLVYISGSRDDFFKSDYRRLKKLDAGNAIEFITSDNCTVDARDRKNESTNSFEGDMNIVMSKLKNIGFEQILGFDLTMPDFDVAVVRVIVPGMEGYKFDYYTPGPRALNFVELVRGK